MNHTIIAFTLFFLFAFSSSSPSYAQSLDGLNQHRGTALLQRRYERTKERYEREEKRIKRYEKAIERLSSSMDSSPASTRRLNRIKRLKELRERRIMRLQNRLKRLEERLEITSQFSPSEELPPPLEIDSPTSTPILDATPPAIAPIATARPSTPQPPQQFPEDKEVSEDLQEDKAGTCEFSWTFSSDEPLDSATTVEATVQVSMNGRWKDIGTAQRTFPQGFTGSEHIQVQTNPVEGYEGRWNISLNGAKSETLLMPLDLSSCHLLSEPSQEKPVCGITISDEARMPASVTDNDFSSRTQVLPTDLRINLKKEFGAKGDGVTDDTSAFKAFFKEYRTKKQDYNGRPHQIFLPAGRYLVSDTISWIGCCMSIRGEGDSQTFIVLKDSASGFSNPADPKPVISMP